MIFSLALLLLLTKLELGSGEKLADRRYKGLKFGNDVNSYVLFKPNMQPVSESFSICGWTKKLRSDGAPYWLAYGTSKEYNEILVSDFGEYHIFGLGISLKSKVPDPLGQWAHHCVTWTASSNTFKAYYNGELIGTKTTTSGKTVGLDGYMVLGNEFDSYGGGFDTGTMFGGEMFKVNVYVKELSASEVLDMKNGGLCSDVEEQYGRTRYLKWEDILLDERHGNVTEIDPGCPGREEETEVEETNNETESSTDSTECECPQQNTTISRWDILYTEVFYNQTLTQDLLEKFKTSWDMLGDFVGLTVSDGFIRHFKLFHRLARSEV